MPDRIDELYKALKDRHNRALCETKFTRQVFRDWLTSLDCSTGSSGVWRCKYCRDFLVLDDISIDHDEPLSLGLSAQKTLGSIENLVISCRQCNERKGDIGGEEYQSLLRLCEQWPAKMRDSLMRRLRQRPMWVNSRRAAARRKRHAHAGAGSKVS